MQLKTSPIFSIDVFEHSNKDVCGGKIYNPVISIMTDGDIKNVDQAVMIPTDVWLLDPETAAEQVATGLLHAFTNVLQQVVVMDIKTGKILDRFEIFAQPDEDEDHDD